MINVTSFLKKAKSRQMHDLTPAPLGILMGVVAFGLCRQSFAAALFPAMGLSFLVYATTERILAPQSSSTPNTNWTVNSFVPCHVHFKHLGV